MSHYKENLSMYSFAEHINDVLENVGMEKELIALFNFGKFYSEHHKMHMDDRPNHNCPECSNSEIDAAALEAFKKVAASAYYMANYDFEDRDDHDEHNSANESE